MDQHLEECSICGDHAGEDSIFWLNGQIGPLCNDCSETLCLEVETDSCELEALRAIVAALPVNASGDVIKLRSTQAAVCDGFNGEQMTVTGISADLIHCLDRSGKALHFPPSELRTPKPESE